MKIGIDLGGTKIAGVLWNGKKVIKKYELPTQAKKGKAQLIANIKKVISELEGEKKYSVGIGIPGTTDGKHIFKVSNIKCLNGVCLEKIMKRKIKILNDANAFAVAEQRAGAAKGKKHVFGLIVGTGIGGGIIIDGKEYIGHHGEAGEPGETFTNQFSGHAWQEQFAGPGLEKMYEELTGKKKPLQEIAKEKSKEAKQVLAYMNQGIAYFCSTISNMLNPEIIVVGGGVSNVLDYKLVNKELKKYSYVEAPKVVKNKLGDDAGVIGAALV